MSSATRIGLAAGSTMPSWPTRMRFVCIAKYRSSSTGLLRDLETLDMEMVLGEADRVVAEFVGQFDLLGQFPQHALV